LTGKYEVTQTSQDNDDRQDDQKSLHTLMLTPEIAKMALGPGEQTENSEELALAS